MNDGPKLVDPETFEQLWRILPEVTKTVGTVGHWLAAMLYDRQ